ncbi:preprotein translocase subunit SecE [Candidatus Woesebacteria bacterium]|nr:preprotein translocase subunit SecE [Candidatus Woesebacteria bacterium]
MVSPFAYLKEVRSELTKVSWPSRATTLNMTLLVVAVSAFLGVYLGVIDYVFRELVTRYL